ncbi:hypothetical protein SODALDRAFT_204543 [Sodiomyces alkalinus F11]|uniref:Uncharacterized protein n=1 Tax=Sodiomyces alkalinus (strain CBS 110278 / VKM F-3762 / F11) TaxID=1314773 RepID=A0A3N2PT92_SODAK|nr:hypothetical protein SODALDRAFT_204543 [Sodiomyces alkalinus F11]ROT37742.1 hypothetical protein SODALDRAFT_204543 [Sodiomyces alkalinus F11]
MKSTLLPPTTHMTSLSCPPPPVSPNNLPVEEKKNQVLRCGKLWFGSRYEIRRAIRIFRDRTDRDPSPQPPFIVCPFSGTTETEVERGNEATRPGLIKKAEETVRRQVQACPAGTGAYLEPQALTSVS